MTITTWSPTTEWAYSRYKEFELKRYRPIEIIYVNNYHRVGSSSHNRPRKIIIKFCPTALNWSIFEEEYAKWVIAKLVINEDLTKLRVHLLRADVDRFGKKKVWTLDGNVFCVENEGRRRKIRSMDDLDQ